MATRSPPLFLHMRLFAVPSDQTLWSRLSSSSTSLASCVTSWCRSLLIPSFWTLTARKNTIVDLPTPSDGVFWMQRRSMVLKVFDLGGVYRLATMAWDCDLASHLAQIYYGEVWFWTGQSCWLPIWWHHVVGLGRLNYHGTKAIDMKVVLHSLRPPTMEYYRWMQPEASYQLSTMFLTEDYGLGNCSCDGVYIINNNLVLCRQRRKGPVLFGLDALVSCSSLYPLLIVEFLDLFLCWVVDRIRFLTAIYFWEFVSPVKLVDLRKTCFVIFYCAHFMGGVGDEEPATKRMKVSPAELRGFSNGSSYPEPVAGSSRDLMARPLKSEGGEDVVGSKGVIKRVEFVRLIANALYSLGYKKSGAHLEEESGIPLHSPVVNLFMEQILNGNWDESLITLQKIGLSDENIAKSASFLILEQKFFELLDEKKDMDALKTLRAEIVPLSIKGSRVHELSSCLVSPSSVGTPGQKAVMAKSRPMLLEELQKLLPPTVMILEKRLEHLVEQALVLQRDACTFHNSLNEEMSLYTDHQCGRDKIPSRTLQILEEHSDEVWFLQFSHKGKYLASSSSDKTAIIWEVDANGELSLKHRLSGHHKPVCSVSWSPDDIQLLTCGAEEVVRRWDVSSGECLHVYEKPGLGLVTCGWFPDGKWIFSGVNDKSISTWELEGKELECWKGQRTLKISDLEITSDGKKIMSTCRDNAILLLDREAKVDILIEEDQPITSFSLSKDDKFLLVNLLNQEIHLWDIAGEAKLVNKYKGHKRSRFIIRSCFGGLQEAFIASGSEDSQVYVWHRCSGELIEALAGHSGSVNCVSWNPVNPHMLASASDDRTIRIWGLKELKLKHRDAHCNGIHYCNGGS